jgi:hypothetical protein
MNNAEDLAVPNDQEIDLDRYAEVLAHTLHFRTAPWGEVLARLGVPEKRWNEAHAKWTRILVEEAAEDDAPAARQFGTAFAVARARLREERPTLESLGPLPVDEAPRAPEPVSAAAAPAPVAPLPPIAGAPPPLPRALEVVEAPPFAFSPGNVSPWAPPGMQMSTPGEGSFAEPPPLVSAYATAPTPPRAVPPELIPAPSPQTTAVPAPPPKVRSALPDLRETSANLDLRRRGALPFQTGGTPEQALADVIARMTAAQGAPPPEGGKQPRAHLGETVGLAPFPVGMVLPFAPDAAAPPAPSWMPAGMLKLVSVEGTQLSTDAPAGPALPFEPATSSQIALENALAEAARLQGPAPGPTKDGGLAGTMELGSLRHLLKPELPFSSPSAPIPAHAPALSIERYASLCVELSATPANAAQTLRRYQLTEPEWITLDADWKARFSREPGARAAWENACSAYRTWLARAGRGKT